MRLRKRVKTSYIRYRRLKPLGAIWPRRLKYQVLSLLYITVLVIPPLAVLLKNDTSDAAVSFSAGDVLGQPDFTSSAPNNKNPSNDGLHSPFGSAIDTVHHRLFIVDSGNNRVLVYNLNGSNQLIDRLADNVLGQADFVSNASQTTRNGFKDPRNAAYDSAHDRLFIADFGNNRVLVFDTGSISNGMNASHVLGQSNFTSSAAVASASGFNGSVGVAYDVIHDRLFVTDLNQNRVVQFDTTSITDGEAAVHVLGQANFTDYGQDTDIKGFIHPWGITYDEVHDRLFVADYLNSRVLVFDTAVVNDYEDAVHVLGQPDFITNSPSPSISANKIYQPVSISYDTAGDRLFVGGDNWGRVAVYDTSSISDGQSISHILGQPNAACGGCDTVPSANGFDVQSGVAFDASTGYLYLADPWQNRLLVFDAATVTDNENAIDVIGQTDSGNSPVFTSGGINNSGGGPSATGFGGDGLSPVLDTLHHRLFVSDSSNCRVLIFNLDNKNNLLDKVPDHVLGQPDLTTMNCDSDADSLGYTGGLAYDSVHDRLFVMDAYSNYRIMVYDTQSVTDGEAAVHILGGSDINSTGDSGLSPSTFDDAEYGGIAYDESAQQLYVDDAYYHYRILIFDLSSGITDGMDASHVLGAPDLNTAGAGDTSATGIYDYYSNLLVDSTHHRLYFSSYYQKRIMVFDVTSITDNEPAVAVLGQPDLNASNSGTTQQGGGGIVGLGYDASRQILFAADYENARILIYDVSSVSDGQPAIGVLGAPDFVTPGSGYGGNEVSQTTMRPYDQANIAFDSVNRRMYFGDDKNARILIYNFPNIVLGDSADSKVTIPNAKFGVPYDYAIPITGTQGTVTCSLESGTLPKDVVITPDCHVKGTPGSNTPYTFTVKVTDDNGVAGIFTDSQVLGLTVEHASSDSGSLADTGSNSKYIGVLALALITVSASTLVRMYSRRSGRRYAARSR
jgi:hypothetical protein